MSRPTALITGGSRGIGAACAVRLAAAGWDVVIGYRSRRDEADAVVADCTALGARAVAVEADLAALDGVARLWERYDAVADRIDGLVNNAGIVPPAAEVADHDGPRIREVLEVDVVAPFLLAGGAVTRMRRGGRGGVIVNISSRAAVLGGSGEYVDYAAAKAALDALTVGLSREAAADGIRVAGVRPGLIDTEIHAPGRLERLGSTPPLGRPGTADEIAAAVAWLMSPDASYVTGATLDVAGGR